MDPQANISNRETSTPSSTDHTSTDAIVEELLATLASGANSGSRGGKRTSDASGSPAGSRKKAALDEADSEDEHRDADLNAEDSDDDTPQDQQYLLPQSFFAASHRVLEEKLNMSPRPWVVSPKYHTPIPLAAVAVTGVFTVFTGHMIQQWRNI